MTCPITQLLRLTGVTSNFSYSSYTVGYTDNKSSYRIYISATVITRYVMLIYTNTTMICPSSVSGGSYNSRRSYWYRWLGINSSTAPIVSYNLEARPYHPYVLITRQFILMTHGQSMGYLLKLASSSSL